MRSRRMYTALILIASLAVAGCGEGSTSHDAKSSAEGSSAQKSDASFDEAAAPEGGAAAAPEKKSGARGVKAADLSSAGAHVIRTAEVGVEVRDAQRALASARRTVLDAGGHVADETTERVDADSVESTAVLRVPQERYDQVLKKLTGSGKLLFRKADAKDVTEQVVDVRSRIATQRASVERVRELMDRAEKISDVVSLEGQLSSRQADLESLLAKQASLKDRTTLATITLTFSEPEEKRKKKEKADPGFLDALGGGWNALAATAGWGAVVIGAVLPFAAVLLPLFVLWRRVARPRLRARAAAAAPAPASPAPLPAPGAKDGPDQG